MELPPKQHRACPLLAKTVLGPGLCWLDFAWPGPAPQGGQFFMIRPERSSRFLARPISAAGFRQGSARFLVALRGGGTSELLDMRPGEKAELTGPLGKGWGNFIPPAPGVLALISGGAGIAPLLALAPELSREGRAFDFYAGFKTAVPEDSPPGAASPALMLCSEISPRPRKLVLATEDGSQGLRGRIPGFLEAPEYQAVFACGPEPMLRATAEKCAAAAVPCYVSLERRMACGVGACLGCTVETAGGNRRCCADGPVFPAEEIRFT